MLQARQHQIRAYLLRYTYIRYRVTGLLGYWGIGKNQRLQLLMTFGDVLFSRIAASYSNAIRCLSRATSLPCSMLSAPSVSIASTSVALVAETALSWAPPCYNGAVLDIFYIKAAQILCILVSFTEYK